MKKFIDINEREKLLEIFSTLRPEAVPFWGKMKPQQMIEHLIEQVIWTNGKKTGICDFSIEEAN